MEFDYNWKNHVNNNDRFLEPKKTDQIRFLISPELKKAFQKICKDKCIDMSKLMHKFVEEYVEKNEEEQVNENI